MDNLEHMDYFYFSGDSQQKNSPQQKLVAVPQLPEEGAVSDFVVLTTQNYHFLKLRPKGLKQPNHPTKRATIRQALES